MICFIRISLKMVCVVQGSGHTGSDYSTAANNHSHLRYCKYEQRNYVPLNDMKELELQKDEISKKIQKY